MHLWKGDKKIGQGPPPSFGQNPKEQQLFSLPLPFQPPPLHIIFVCVSLFRSLKPDSSILTVWHILMHPTRTEQKTSCFSYLLILVLCLTASKKIEVSISLGNNQHLFWKLQFWIANFRNCNFELQILEIANFELQILEVAKLIRLPDVGQRIQRNMREVRLEARRRCSVVSRLEICLVGDFLVGRTLCTMCLQFASSTAFHLDSQLLTSCLFSELSLLFSQSGGFGRWGWFSIWQV